MPTLSQLLSAAGDKLTASDSARLDAEILLAFALNKPRSFLYSHPELEISASAINAFNALIEQRQQGSPVAYLTGRKEFWSLPLSVNETTLIPRPDTELLVEQALKKIPENAARMVADLGTGSGAIAIAIASERPRCHVVASDCVYQSLVLARQNAEQTGLKNITFICANWGNVFNANSLDVIVSNPPYIADNDPHLSSGDVRFEPRHALAAGPAGLDDLTAIIRQSTAALKPGGWILLEHGYDQQQAVQQLLRDNNYSETETCRDLAGNPRVSIGQIRKMLTGL